MINTKEVLEKAIRFAGYPLNQEVVKKAIKFHKPYPLHNHIGKYSSTAVMTEEEAVKLFSEEDFKFFSYNLRWYLEEYGYLEALQRWKTFRNEN